MQDCLSELSVDQCKVTFLFWFVRVIFWSLGCSFGENVIVALPNEVLCSDRMAISVFSVSCLNLVFVDIAFL